MHLSAWRVDLHLLETRMPVSRLFLPVARGISQAAPPLMPRRGRCVSVSSFRCPLLSFCPFYGLPSIVLSDLVGIRSRVLSSHALCPRAVGYSRVRRMAHATNYTVRNDGRRCPIPRGLARVCSTLSSRPGRGRWPVPRPHQRFILLRWIAAPQNANGAGCVP